MTASSATNEPGMVDWNKAALLLDQAVRAGSREPAAAYLLAMCYKRLGRNAEARAALARIAEPDANVHLQRGLLAFAEREFTQAEEAFAHSFAMEPSYAAGYNCLLACLCRKQSRENETPSQEKAKTERELIEQLLPLAPDEDERRFLSLLQILLNGVSEPAVLDSEVQQTLASISLDDETRLVEMLTGMGQFEVVFPLLRLLVKLRPHSNLAHQAFFQAALVRGKELVDHGRWEQAQAFLLPLTRPEEIQAGRLDNQGRIVLFNLLGTCSCMVQDFERGAWYFRSALEVFQQETQAGKSTPTRKARSPWINSHGIYQEAWLQQNLALAYEWQGKLDKAETHWKRYFDFLEPNFASSLPPEYLPALAFEGLSRVAEVFTRKEKWPTALGFLQRAHKIRPTDPDILERLFHLYDQLGKPQEARKILRRLREVRPHDPQVELFEMDVREVRDLEDLDRFLGDLRRLQQKNTGNVAVEERASTLVGQMIPFMEKLYEQSASQINRVAEQMRRLPSYQINWPVVREVMHDLEEKFFVLRRAANKALSLARGDVRADLQKIITRCDRKIDQCHSLVERN